MRDIFLIIHNNNLFAAHWSIWIPNARQANGEDLGKVLHVTGNPVTGFVHEVKRGYDLGPTRQGLVFVLLGKINDEMVVDQKEELIITASDEDVIEPVDPIEELALTVPAPKKTMRSVNDDSKKSRTKIENCQNWIGHFVDLLVDRNLLDANARSLVENAPKH